MLPSPLWDDQYLFEDLSYALRGDKVRAFFFVFGLFFIIWRIYLYLSTRDMDGR